MKKRQMKKNTAKTLKQLDDFRELWEVLKKHGVYRFDVGKYSDNEKTECQMSVESFIKLPFLNKKEVVINERGMLEYPFEAVFEIKETSFKCLLSRKELIKFFPEFAKKDKYQEYVEINGVRYLKEVQTNE